jgi:hypothetical protein
MKSRYIFVLILLIVIILSCRDKKARWATYTSTEGGFSVFMPEKPNTTTKTLTTAFGKQKVHFVTWKPQDLTLEKFSLIQISYTDFPAKFRRDTFTKNRLLDTSMSMRIKDFSSDENQFAERINFNGYPALAYIYDKPLDNVVIVKECIVNDRLYDLVIIAKKNYPTNAEIKDFFNSFVIIRN